VPIPAIDQIDQLPHAELVALVKTLIVEVQRLQLENHELKAEIEKLRKQPASSSNSSLPPSRDQKRNIKGKRRKKHGPRYGHQRVIRPLVDDPDQVIEATVQRCEHCQTGLEGVPPEKILRHQITELPPIKPVVIETRQHEVICRECQRVNRGVLPEELNLRGSFGPRLSAVGVYLKHEQHIGYKRVRRVLKDLFGVSISEGGLDGLLREAGLAAQVVAEEIRKQVVTSEIIGSDETSARVKGRTCWEWVLVSARGIFHAIRPTRSASVIEELMGDNRVSCWICDCYGAQLKAPADHFQLCLAHQLRDLKRLIESCPRFDWALKMQKLFRAAIHLWNQKDGLTIDQYVSKAMLMEERLDRLLQWRLIGKDALRLQQRFIKHRDHLFTFLRYPGVEPTNNACERALRPSVIHRKVTNGFRSEWGAHAYAALRTISSTARQQGKQFFDELAALFGPQIFKPILT
jgi:transposase